MAERGVSEGAWNRIIVDREGMAVEFLTSLHAAGRMVVTVVWTGQYRVRDG